MNFRERLQDLIAEDAVTEQNNKEKYQALFREIMKKWGIDNITDLKTKEQKKKFFDEIDRAWKAKKETD